MTTARTPLKLDGTNLVPTVFQSGDVIGVANGGTGLATITADGLLVGNGTSAATILAVGSTNQVLTVVSGAPAWAAAPLSQGLIIGGQTNGDSGTDNICTPVYISAANTLKKAEANSFSTSRVAALIYDTSISSSGTGNYQISGIFTATTAQWDAVAGTSGGLAAGTVYYLSDATAGVLTSTAPSTAGHFLVPVILGLSSTQAVMLLPILIVGL